MREVTNPAVLASIVGGMSPPARSGESPLPSTIPEPHHSLTSIEATPDVLMLELPAVALVETGQLPAPSPYQSIR